MLLPCCFGFCCFIVCFVVRYCDASSFVLVVQGCFGYLGSSVVSCKFEDFFLFLWKCHWHFDRNYIESIYLFGYYGHFNIIFFQFMNVGCPVILHPLQFLSECWNFHHRGLSIPWLSLLIGILFLSLLWMALISFLAVLLAYKNATCFCMLIFISRSLPDFFFPPMASLGFSYKITSSVKRALSTISPSSDHKIFNPFYFCDVRFINLHIIELSLHS